MGGLQRIFTQNKVIQNFPVSVFVRVRERVTISDSVSASCKVAPHSILPCLKKVLHKKSLLLRVCRLYINLTTNLLKTVYRKPF